MKSIGFVILTWNSERYIKSCLDSIFSIPDFVIKIVVCDNGSNDGTVEILREYQEKIDIILLNQNFGTTISRNLALKEIGENDYICILDSDTVIVNPNEFKCFVKQLDNHPDYGIIGPRLIDEDGELQFSGRNIPTFREKLLKVMPFKSAARKAARLEHVDYSNRESLFAVGYLMSACLLMKFDTFKKIGFFDEKIFYAPEDVEYCMRCWENGFKVGYFQDYTIVHYWQRLSRKKFFSKHNYSHIKGLLYLRRKYKKSLKKQIREKTK